MYKGYALFFRVLGLGFMVLALWNLLSAQDQASCLAVAYLLHGGNGLLVVYVNPYCI